jgi:hypothetical protein
VLELPPGAVSIGGSSVTHHHGWMRGGNILTFAHHPEYCFDPWILEQMMDIERVANSPMYSHVDLPAQFVDLAREKMLTTKTDYVWMMQQLFRFFMGQLSL